MYDEPYRGLKLVRDVVSTCCDYGISIVQKRKPWVLLVTNGSRPHSGSQQVVRVLEYVQAVYHLF